MFTKKTEDEYYETSDLYLAAALLCHNYQIEQYKTKFHPNTRRGKGYFFFKDDGKLQSVIDQFMKHKLLVEPIEYSNAVKEIKNRIFNH